MLVVPVPHGVDGTATGVRDATRLSHTDDESGFIAVHLESPGAWYGGNGHPSVLSVLELLSENERMTSHQIRERLNPDASRPRDFGPLAIRQYPGGGVAQSRAATYNSTEFESLRLQPVVLPQHHTSVLRCPKQS